MEPTEYGPGARWMARAAGMAIGIIAAIYAISTVSNLEAGTRVAVAALTVLVWALAAIAAVKLPFGDEEDRTRRRGIVPLAIGLAVLIGAILRFVDAVDTATPIILALMSGWFGALAVRSTLQGFRLRT